MESVQEIHKIESVTKLEDLSKKYNKLKIANLILCGVFAIVGIFPYLEYIQAPIGDMSSISYLLAAMSCVGVGVHTAQNAGKYMGLKEIADKRIGTLRRGY